MLNNCLDERNFTGLLCGQCPKCDLFRSVTLMEGSLYSWEEFKNDWYLSFLHREKRKKTYMEETRYKVLGERYHNFITINLENIDSNNTYYDKIVNWDIEWLKGAKGVMEFYTEKGKHPHFHIISYVVRQKTTLIRDCSKKFGCAPNFIDIVKNKFMYDKHIDYINGLKVKNKQEYIDMDQKERKKYGIPEVLNW